MQFSLRFAATIAAILTLAPQCARAADPYGLDLAGRPVRELGGTGTRAVVLVFAASDCPICNRYVPEIARLSAEFSPQGARFWWVYPNPEDTASLVGRHNTEFAIQERTILDTRQTLTAWAHATTTPEAAVFLVDGDVMRQVYRGRIDDRYLSIGQERPHARQHELEAAIAAALAGKPVPQPTGPPVGCAIVPLPK